MSTIKRIAKNSGWQFLSNIAQKVFSLVFVIVLARQLGVENFGLYSFAFSFVAVFTIFADFGINLLFLREVAKNTSDSSEFVSNALFLKIILSAMSFFGIIIFGLVYGITPNLFLLVVLAAISMLLDNISSVFKSVFFAFEVFKYEFLVTFIYRTFFLAVSLFLIFNGYGLTELMVISVVSSLIYLSFSIFYSFKHIKIVPSKINKNSIINILKTSSLFFVISFLLSFIANISIILLQYFDSQAEVGYFSAASKLVFTLAMFSVIFINSIQPVLIKFYFSKNNSFKTLISKSAYYLSIFIFPISIGTFILSSQITFLFYGQDFFRAIAPLSILAISSIFSFSNDLFTNVLTFTHKEKNVLIQIGLEALAQLGFGIVLIYLYAEIGAALGFLLARIFSFLIGYYFVSKYFTKLGFLEVYLKPLIASLVMGAFTLWFAQFGVFLAIFLSSLIYLIALLIVKAFSKEDILFFKKVIRGNPNENGF